MKARTKLLCVILFAVAALSSCSTTRMLPDGEYRLAKNVIEFDNKNTPLTQKDVQNYIKQQPNSYFVLGWNPFLSVWNWQNGKNKAWDKAVRKIGVQPIVYDPEQVELSIDNIDSHLTYLGYYGNRIDTRIELKKRNVIVHYLISPGKTYPISSIETQLPGGRFDEIYMRDSAAFTIRSGSMLSEAMLEAETVRSASAMRNEGFYTFTKNNFVFEADTLEDRNAAKLKMTILDHSRNETPAMSDSLRVFHFGNVTMSYPSNLSIREKVLYRMNTIYPGNVYRESDVNLTYSRLASLNVFSNVNIETQQRGKDSVDCRINLTPAKIQGFKLNGEFSVNSTGLFGISPKISYFNRNIFRGGEWLNLSFAGNFQFKTNDDVRSNEYSTSMSLSFPRFLLLPDKFFKGTSPRTEMNFSYNSQSRPEYDRTLISAGYAYNGTSMNNLFRYQVTPFRLSIVKLFHLDEDFYSALRNDPFMRNAYEDHFDMGIGGTFYWTSNSTSSKERFYMQLQTDLSGNLLSLFNPLMNKVDGIPTIWNTRYSQYAMGELTLGRTWTFGRSGNRSLATRIVTGAGYAYGYSSSLPFEKRFYAGGANSLRGWQSRSVGPGTAIKDETFVIPNQTGDMRLEGNIEYRFPMVWKLEGALFTDVGNVWTIKETSNDPEHPTSFSLQNLGKSFAADCGFGVRLDLNFLLLRIDMGMKVHDPSAEIKWISPNKWLKKKGYAIHFGVGYPF